MKNKYILIIVLILAVGMFSLKASHAQSDNWLDNPCADSNTDAWNIDGDAGTEIINGNPAFVIRNGGHLSQEIPLTADLAGAYMLVVGLAWTERSNADRNITGLPYFYAYEMESVRSHDYEDLYINKYLRVTDMLHAEIDLYEWVALWNIFQIADSTNTVELFLMQAERSGVPHNGSAARFDDLGVYFFNSLEDAEAFVLNYYL